MLSQSKIDRFDGDYAFLSNFYPAPTEFEGVLYPTSEHAYQAAKTLDPEERAHFHRLTAGQAKRFGRTVTMREDWEDIKVSVMRAVLFDKFKRNPALRDKLLQTEESYLEEGNNWGDTHWGTVNGKGKNVLGILLMIVRGLLRYE